MAPEITLDLYTAQVLADVVTKLRSEYTTITSITNSVRREPADTPKLKRAGENMERTLRWLEELITKASPGSPAPGA